MQHRDKEIDKEHQDSRDIVIPLGQISNANTNMNAGMSIDEAEPPLPLHRPVNAGRIPKQQQLILAAVVFLSLMSFFLMIVWMYQIEMDLDFSAAGKWSQNSGRGRGKMNQNAIDSKAKEIEKGIDDDSKNSPDTKHANQKKLYTIVMPMILKDIGRFKLFYYTYKKFFREDGLAAFLIITPEDQFDEMKENIAEISGNSPIFKIISDLLVVPELKKHDGTIGWMKQQIIKLAAADYVDTDFYLVLDADLIVVQPTGVEQLFTTIGDEVLEGHTTKDYTLLAPKRVLEHGETAESMINWDESDPITPIRSLTNMEPKNAPKGSRPDWYEGAEKFLNMQMDPDLKWVYGVTPAILATPIVKGIHEHLGKLAKAGGSEGWRHWFFENLFVASYTEYAIYYVYAVTSGMFDKYHVPVENGMYQHFNSIWWKDSFNDIEKLLEDALRPGRMWEGGFMVIQSNTQVEVSEYEDKVKAAVEKVTSK